MPSKKSRNRAKAKKAPGRKAAGKALTLRIAMPGKKLSMLVGVMAAMFLLVLVVGFLSPNGKITTRAVIVEKLEQPETLSPSQACDQAGGEVVLVQDCSVVNVMQNDFGLKRNQVCCLKGMH